MSTEDRVQSEEWFTLTEGEHLEDVTHPSIWTVVPQIIFGIVFSLGSLYVLFEFSGQYDEALYLGLGGFVLGLAMAGIAEFKRRHEWFVLTNQQVKRKSGIVSVKVRQARYDDIQDVTKRIELYERVLGYGDIHITTAGSATTEFVLKGVPDPNQMREKVVQLVDHATHRTYVNDGTQAGQQQGSPQGNTAQQTQQQQQPPANSQQQPQNGGKNQSAHGSQGQQNGQPPANSQQTPQNQNQQPADNQQNTQPPSDQSTTQTETTDTTSDEDMWDGDEDAVEGNETTDADDTDDEDDDDDSEADDVVGVDPFDDSTLDKNN